MIGQLVFAMGGLLDIFWLMIVGRFIFGIGAESLAVAQNNYAVLWFKGKELNMVFGLQLSFARVGSTVNFMVMEPLYKYVNQFYKGHMCTGVVLLLASTTCLMSFFCALILGWMDKRAQRILRRNDNPGGEIAKLTDVKTFKITFWMVSIICVAYYVAIFPFIALGKYDNSIDRVLGRNASFLILRFCDLLFFAEYSSCENMIFRRRMQIQSIP